MAFEITVREALAILQVTRAELRFLVERGDLQESVVRNGRGQVVRRVLHYEEAVELAKRLERPVPIPRRAKSPRPPKQPRDPSLITTVQAVRTLGTRLANLHKLVAEGRLPVAEETSRARYFRQKDVVALMEKVQTDHGLPPRGLELAPGDELIGAVRAAKLLQSSASTVYYLMKKGDLPVARFNVAGMRLFRRSDVLALASPQGAQRRRSRKTA